MSNAYLILSTIDDHRKAVSLSRTLIEERLVACVNIVSNLDSIYRWQGEIRQEAEYLMVLKTSGDSLDRAQSRLAQLHPYEVPEVIAVEVNSGNAPYLAWIQEETEGS